MYLMRLDDASEYMDIDKWLRMEQLLDKYNVKPIFGIIPNNSDPDLLKYGKVDDFWELMQSWQNKGWIPALHGYTHVFETEEGGINPVNLRSEFAGLSFEKQCEKIMMGEKILLENGIKADIFFAPAHTFDDNTIKALKKVSNIRCVSDTIASNVYCKDDVFFVPQQSGKCRKLPFKVVTFCYHPNIMSDCDFFMLEESLKKMSFSKFEQEMLKKRKKGLFDRLLERIYFCLRIIKKNRFLFL